MDTIESPTSNCSKFSIRYREEVYKTYKGFLIKKELTCRSSRSSEKNLGTFSY